MSKIDKLILKILSGNSDKNIDFEELIKLLTFLRFEFRTKGSHHIFWKDGIEEILNIQSDGSKAKPYQVKQVRNIIIKYKLIKDEY
jgi:predicted RNA binding protein YcfA (HicA-like mRNA interferase family)